MMRSATQFLDRVPERLKKSATCFVPMTSFQRGTTICLLALYLAWIWVQQQADPTPTAASGWVFLALFVNFLLLLLPVIFYRPSYGWFHPLIFGLFLTLTEHLRRTVIYAEGLHAHVALPGLGEYDLTLLLARELALCSLGLLAYYIGFWLGPTQKVPRIAFRQPRRLVLKVGLAILASVGVFLAYMQSRGGVIAHIVSWGRGRRMELAGDSYWGFFIQFGLTACLFWLAMDRKAHLRPLFWGCAGISLLITFLSSGSRSSIIYSIAMGLLVWLLRERKIAPTKILIFVLIALFLIGLLGNFRRSTFDGKIDWSTLTNTASNEMAIVTAGLEEVSARSGEGDAVFPILARVPKQVDFIQGSSYLAVLTLPIPRGLWPEKPGLIGGQTGETFFRAPAGVPPGPIGEAYWNFGMIGVPFVFLIFGIFYRWLTAVFARYADQPVAIVLYIITLFRLSEPSSQAVVHWLITFVLSVIFLYLIGAISRPRRRYQS
jgi:oligosaccharide repeat unit polymerase